MRLLALIGAIAIVVAIAVPIYFFGGFLNVSASEPHFDIVAWSLDHIRKASVSRHATDKPAISLDDPAVVQAGAKTFSDLGCASCHGAPGGTWMKFSEGLNPSPAELKEVGQERTPAELFWVVKNGLKFTGMPGFGSIGVKDEEIWKVVAFVKKLPKVSDADYKTWTAR
jgi:mono/diheme cytochrome c family protein